MKKKCIHHLLFLFVILFGCQRDNSTDAVGPTTTQPSLSVSCPTEPIPANGGTYTCTIANSGEQSINWSVTLPSFLSGTTSGSIDAEQSTTISYTVTTNTQTSTRNGVLSFGGNGETRNISVSQSGRALSSPSLSVSCPTDAMPADGGTYTCTITNSGGQTLNWNVTLPSFLTGTTSGSLNAAQSTTISYIATANTQTSTRNGMLAFGGNGGTRNISVSQSGRALSSKTFSETFSSGIGHYFSHGSPSPFITDAQGREHVLDPNGDANYRSGIVINNEEAEFILMAGLEISFDYYLNASPSISFPWNEGSVGFVDKDFSPCDVGEGECSSDPAERLPAPRFDPFVIRRGDVSNQHKFVFIHNIVHGDATIVDGNAISFSFNSSGWHNVKYIVIDENSYELYLDNTYIATIAFTRDHRVRWNGLYGKRVYPWLAGRTLSTMSVLLDNLQIKQ